jgi:conjugal transfer pilus assembly protein TraW
MSLMPKSFSPRRVLAGGLLAGALLAGVAFAHDYGVQGHVWAIIEVDMRELLMKSLAKQNWDKTNEDLKDNAIKFFDNLPKHSADPVTHTTTRWIDPSFTLDKDVYAPKKNAQGEWEWKLLFAKGTKANPLSVQRPYNVMLFFDVTSPAQVAFVSEAVRRHPGKFLPVELSGGNPTHLSDKIDTPVFSASDSMINRFHITESPTLLYPGTGEHALELGATTFAAPFSQDTLDDTWPEGLRPGKAAHP